MNKNWEGIPLTEFRTMTPHRPGFVDFGTVLDAVPSEMYDNEDFHESFLPYAVTQENEHTITFSIQVGQATETFVVPTSETLGFAW